MSQDDSFGAPAGWYPDPLGLPQLRWWNNHAWTEQTSAARQPMVMQDTKFAWADDELPTRREERERERQHSEREPSAAVRPTAATLRALEPPRAFTKIDEPPASTDEQAGHSDSSQQDFPRHDSSPQDGAAFGGAPFGGAPHSQHAAPTPSFDSLFGAEPATRASARRTAAAPGPYATVHAESPLVSTAPAWIIAMLPLFQLVLSLLLLTALGMGSNVSVFIAILTVPYLIVIVLAFVDQRMLRRRGVERPAHWTWSLLTAPIYLVARARAVVRESGHGIGPVLVWFGLGTLHLASVVAIPGLLIAVLPGVFTSQLEASVEGDALLISGAEMSVTCPVTPPVLFGELTVCQAVSSSGKNSDISVSLERANGWIEWQVLDWGVWGIEQ
ncbi:MAG: hypothetical protein JWM50_2320 [Microbacteriaceae bacterium]|nr:hypothetical protein [Microbacteriaceae bacterium]